MNDAIMDWVDAIKAYASEKQEALSYCMAGFTAQAAWELVAPKLWFFMFIPIVAAAIRHGYRLFAVEKQGLLDVFEKMSSVMLGTCAAMLLFIFGGVLR